MKDIGYVTFRKRLNTLCRTHSDRYAANHLTVVFEETRPRND